MNLGGDNKKETKNSQGIFSKMRGLLGGKEKNQEEDYVEEKETLKKFDEVVKHEENTKNFHGLKGAETRILDKPIQKQTTKKEDIGKKEKEQQKIGSVPEGENAPQKEEKSSRFSKEKFKEMWQAPKILKTNLAKGEQTVFIDWDDDIKKLGVVTALSVFLIAVVYVGLIVWGLNTKSKGKLLDSDIDYLKSQLSASAKEVEEIDVFNEKLKNANALLDKHVYWTNVFDFVEKNVLKRVQIVSSISGEPTTDYSFSILTDDFTTLNQQIRHFKDQEEIISVEFDGGTVSIVKGEDEIERSMVSSNISIVLDPNIFFSVNEQKKK